MQYLVKIPGIMKPKYVKHCDLRKKTKMTNLMRNEIIYLL